MNGPLNAVVPIRGDETTVSIVKDNVMGCFVYVLGSSGKNGYRTYVGWTIAPGRRLAEHNAGRGARSTNGRSWTLLCVERACDTARCHEPPAAFEGDRRFRKLLVEAK